MSSARKQSRRSWRALLVAFGAAAAVFVGVWYGLWWYRLSNARKSLVRHDAAKAMSWLNSALSLRKNHAESHFLAARAARRLGDSEAFRHHLQCAHDLGFPRQRLQRELTLTKAQLGMLDEAEPHFREMLLNPGEDGAEICAAFASGFVHHYQFKRAFDVLEAWQQDFPHDAEPWLMRGKLFRRWQNWAAAESEFKEALARDTDLFEARLALAGVLSRQHKYESAEQQYRACLDANGELPGPLLGWADCLTNLGRTADATAIYKRIVDQHPDNAFARLGLGRIALQNSDAEEAVSWLDPVVRADPRHLATRYSFAQALAAAGRPSEAAEHFAYFNEASPALSRVADLTQRLIKHPGDVQTRFDVGRLYMKYGSPAEGAEWLKTVLALDANHTATHVLLTDYYDETEQTDLAREHRAHIKKPAETAGPDQSGVALEMTSPHSS